MGPFMVRNGARAFAFASTALTVASVFAGLASADSTSPVSVVVWNESGELKADGEVITVWAQVFWQDVPTNASNVTFHWGLSVPPVFTPDPYPGTYAGSPGLYRADVTVRGQDVSLGVGFLEVTVDIGGEVATNARYVWLGASIIPSPPSPPEWTVSVGLDNAPFLGSTLDPGETIEWRVVTAQNGTPTNASSLVVRLFEAPQVTYGETPTVLSCAPVSAGTCTVATAIPSSLAESRQYVVQAEISEANFASVNASADVWFLDTVVEYAVLNGTLVSGTLTVGDGVDTQAGVNASLELTNSADLHHVGWINGTTDANGQLAFAVANDGSPDLDVRGWLNGTRAQWVSAAIIGQPPSDYTPPSPTGAPLDAVPLDNLSALMWDREQTARFAFYQNGSAFANATVLAFVSSARGLHGQANLTTDENGTATLAVDFRRAPPATDDFAFMTFGQGVNLTFRAAIGGNANSSDGAFWAQDEEKAWINPIPGFVRSLIDANLSFTTETMRLGSTFGVGLKYGGPMDVSGYESASLLFPTSILSLFDGPTERFDVWTANGEPRMAYMVGAGREFYGSLQVPSYWPDTTYTLVGAVVPSLAILGGGGLPTAGSLNWIPITPDQARLEFVPSPDTTAPRIFAPSEITTANYHADFAAHVYDDSLDFHANGTVVWSFDDGTGPQSFAGEAGAWDFPYPGDFNVTITATDSSGNRANFTLVVHVLDTRAPSVVADGAVTAEAGVPTTLPGTATDDDRSFDLGSALSWSFAYNGSNQTILGANPTFTFWTLGTYNVTVTATDAAGNNASTSMVVTVVDTTAPTPNAGPDRTVDAGTTVDFNGSATDNDPAFPLGATCNWTFTYNGTPQEFAAVNFSFVFWALGPIDLTFSCSDGSGNHGGDSVQITVQKPDRVPPTVSAGADVTILTGETVTFTGTATDNDPNFPTGAAFSWTFIYNGSLQNLSGQSASFDFWAAGTFTVTFRAADGWGNAGVDVMVVTVRLPDTTPPTIAAIADRTAAPGAIVAVTAGVSDDDPTFATTGNISWTFTYNGSAVTRYGAAFAFTFDVEGNFTVTVAARDAAGNSATPRSFVVRVARPDTTPPSATATADAASVQAGTLVTFTGSATDAGAAITDPGRFTWTFAHNGSLVTLNGLTPSFRFEKEGTYTVTLTVRDAANNAGTAQVTVTVLPPTTPTAPEAGLPLLWIALLAAVALGVVGFVLTRKRGGRRRDAAGGPPTREREAPKEPEDESAPESEDEDKDLDDLLK